jgi:hypothetical protein
MVAGGLWVPRRLRAPKIQQPRSRRACLGELVQIDGCDHRWFEVGVESLGLDRDQGNTLCMTNQRPFLFTHVLV